MEKATLKATQRKEFRKNAVKKLRTAGLIPAVIYGEKKEPVHVTVNSIEFEKALRTEFRRNTILKLDIDDNGKTYSEYVVTYNLQRDILTPQITHIDFLRVVEGTPVKLTIPLSFQGVAPGTKRGGTLIKKMDTVLVSTLPKQIPNEIVVDISNLNIGGFITVSQLDQGTYKILSPATNSIIRIAAPRVAVETTDDLDTAESTDTASTAEANGSSD